MKAWKPAPEDNSRAIVAILRGLLSFQEHDWNTHRARYKDLWDTVSSEFASETTFQVYLNWLVKKRLVKKEKRSRKEVWYSVNSGDSAILNEMSDTIRAMRKLRMKDIHFKDIVENFALESAFGLMVAITENLDDRPIDDVSRKLGPVQAGHLLAENARLSFLAAVGQALYSKNPSALYSEALGGIDIKITQAHPYSEEDRKSVV
jgi:predicted transcriptional regulator